MIHKILPPAVTGAVVMLIGFNLAPVVAEIYWPQDQWVALLTAAFMVFAAVLLPRLLVADRGLPGADLRLPAVVGLRRRLRPDPLDHRLQQRRAPRPRPGQLGGRQGRRLDRLPERRPRRRRLRRARPQLLADLHPARAARRHRADRREHRPRQGRRGDDRREPRPLHGPRHRRGRPRHRPGQRLRRLAHHDVRREHRRHGRHPGLLHRGVLRRGGGGHPARSLPEVRRRSSAPPRAACSAGSPSSCTA